MSMVSENGTSWRDITLDNKTVCLKVYTVKDDTKIINNKDISVDYLGGSYYSVKVVTADGHIVVGALVKFTIAGKTYTIKTDANGIAKIKINLVPNKYTVTASCNGKQVKNIVTVKQVIMKKSDKEKWLKSQTTGNMNMRIIIGNIYQIQCLNVNLSLRRNFMHSLMSNLLKNWLMSCMRKHLWVIWLLKGQR